MSVRFGMRCLAIAVVLPALTACRGEPDPAQLDAMFERGETLCLDGRFEDAKRLFKAYLIYRPEDAGAHYYLGRTYMLSEDFRPVMAEGEYQTALRLFVKGERISPIERFAPEYFEMICYVDSAKVLYLQSGMLATAGAPPRILRGPLQQAADYLREAETVLPEAREIEQVRGGIRALAERAGVPLRPPESAPPPT